MRVRKVRLKKQKKSVDKKLLILTLVLTVLGLIAVADASAPVALSSFSDKFYFAKQQVAWAALGVVLLLVFSKVNYSILRRFALPIYLASVATLILVLVPGIGAKALGARRWFVAGPISFQPSEFVKLSLAIYLAKVAEKKMRLLSYFLPIVLASTLIMFQPDLGTTIILVAMGLSQIFMSGASLFTISAAILAGAIASSILIITSDYRRSRLVTFLNQAQDPRGAGYHIRQILYALGAGGLTGVGLGQSRQKYLFLPEAATDSIFAIIAEEAGFLGAGFVIFLFALFIFWGLNVAKNAPDTFSYILSVGIVAWIGGQAFLNIASMVALVPLTGVPLPFFSYGGSSLTAALLACGILLNISRYAAKTR